MLRFAKHLARSGFALGSEVGVARWIHCGDLFPIKPPLSPSASSGRFIYTLKTVNAEIIAIGSELLTPFRQDTNSLYLTEKLNQLGVEVILKLSSGTAANISRERPRWRFRVPIS